MVYDWEDKQETCYRMYVVERRSLDDVMKFFKDEVGFVPSKRAFQTQFRRWGFPSKQNPAHRNEALVARTRELWERNTTQKDMISILHAEGYTISERELMRLRSKHRLLLRGANAVKSASSTAATPDLDSVEQTAPLQSPRPVMAMSEALDEAIEQPTKRKERLDEMQKASDERWDSRKRRRRSRGWAGLPADPPGPPRFPSETTLESSKACLDLNNSLYLEIRASFQTICQEQKIVKKTSSGPERWQNAKTQLIQRYPQIDQAFQQAEPSRLDQMRLSLDVICMDVTKRLRTMEHQMTLAEAKNMLNINPEEGRRMRQVLIEILTAHNFINKHESDNWEQLKQLWIIQSGLGHRIPPPGSSNRDQCLRAVQVICRDIMKRWRDAQVGQGKGKPVKHREGNQTSDGQQVTARPMATAQRTRRWQQPRVPVEEQSESELAGNYDFQIDPSLLMATKESPLTLENPYAVGAAATFSDTLHETGTHGSVYFP